MQHNLVLDYLWIMSKNKVAIVVWTVTGFVQYLTYKPLLSVENSKMIPIKTDLWIMSVKTEKQLLLR